MVGKCRANVSSLANFPKWPFWRVLEFAKTGEFLASTQIRQICRRVAIAYLINQMVVLSRITLSVFQCKYSIRAIRKIVFDCIVQATLKKLFT